jgi:hypothetical protein
MTTILWVRGRYYLTSVRSGSEEQGERVYFREGHDELFAHPVPDGVSYFNTPEAAIAAGEAMGFTVFMA